MAALNKKEVSSLYRRRARHYNFTANLYYLIGFREHTFRKKAVDALNLKKGNTVVEIGCGTGLNFSLLQNAVGPEGKIVGVDLTEEMLDQAKNRIKDKGWNNVELVHSDAAQFQFPDGIDGVISTFAITLIPEFDEVIRNGCKSLNKGKRWVILDFKMPSNWLSYLAPLYIFITKPFAVTKDLIERHPWESINKYLENTSFIELYKGVAYIAIGEKEVNYENYKNSKKKGDVL